MPPLKSKIIGNYSVKKYTEKIHGKLKIGDAKFHVGGATATSKEYEVLPVIFSSFWEVEVPNINNNKR